MNCRSCGGPIETASASHGSCGYCGGVQAVAAAGDEGVVLLAGETGGDCPTCRVPLRRASLDGRAAAACPGCLGVLVTREAFTGVTEARRSAWTGGDVTCGPPAAAELTARRECPRCRRPFETYPFCGPGNVVLDACDPCGLIWLDATELTRIERAPGRRQAQPTQRRVAEVTAEPSPLEGVLAALFD